MPRTSTTAVKAILMRDYDGAADLSPFIQTAGIVVDRLATRSGARWPMIAAELELLERWLAAHFYCCSDRTYKSRSTGRASGSFDGSTGMGFDSTVYGQQAKMIDPSGGLAFLETKEKIPVIVGGFWSGGGTNLAGAPPGTAGATGGTVGDRTLTPDNPVITTPYIAPSEAEIDITTDTLTIDGANFDTDL